MVQVGSQHDTVIHLDRDIPLDGHPVPFFPPFHSL
jgi:hypothetical protein